ncbi:MAG TPA: benzoate-CoA ligase family protein [Longimicrobiaceae bacterium]|nr:benzoate-CoA ligase family protein [Longimicrobiaceae bacterium]
MTPLHTSDPIMLPSAPTAHLDTFARDHLPPRDQWPVMDYSGLPELSYPPRLNCAAELLDRMAQGEGGHRTALVFPGGRWSYRELLETANRVAHVLRDDLGLVPGNRVLLRGPNNPWMVACWFAVLKAGGIAVATMPLLRRRELSAILDKAQIGIALTDHRLTEELDAARSASPVLRTVAAFGGGGEGSLEAMAAGKPAEFDNVDTAADDVALIAFTSGTTGQAKGTVHFHRDVLACCDCFPPHVLRASPEDLFCGSPPLAFTYGLGGILLFPMRIGAATLLLENASPPNLVAGIAGHRATVVFTAPTAYRAMVDMVAAHDLSSLRKCVSAGEPLPAATFEAWRAATGLGIIDGIGSTEMLHIFISSSGDDIRPGSTGRAVPGYRARIVDDAGNEVPPGTIGRLAVQGPTGCRYLDNEERQRAYVQNGWNLTGDAYRMDEDGYFWYQARGDDMIISSGYNIAGPEVENALLDHPAVLECGVVGVPDMERGQVVKAFVVLRDGTEETAATVKELQDWVKGQIAPYKYPRQVEFVSELPRTPTGKLQRFRLREKQP